MSPREYEQGAERRNAHESPGQNVRHMLDASTIHSPMREKEHAERLAKRPDQGCRDDEQAYDAKESATGRPTEVCRASNLVREPTQEYREDCRLKD
jgi:hypothetical protein